MTLAQAMKEAKANGYNISKLDGEYRVAPTKATLKAACLHPERTVEDYAYYTDDIEDAVGTMYKEADWFKKQIAIAPADPVI